MALESNVSSAFATVKFQIHTDNMREEEEQTNLCAAISKWSCLDPLTLFKWLKSNPIKMPDLFDKFGFDVMKRE